MFFPREGQIRRKDREGHTPNHREIRATEVVRITGSSPWQSLTAVCLCEYVVEGIFKRSISLEKRDLKSLLSALALAIGLDADSEAEDIATSAGLEIEAATDAVGNEVNICHRVQQYEVWIADSIVLALRHPSFAPLVRDGRSNVFSADVSRSLLSCYFFSNAPPPPPSLP